MKIAFHTPPASKQIGGLENAIAGLRQALFTQGAEVVLNPGAEEGEGAIHHIHGLWNWKNTRIARSLRKASLPYVVSPHGMLEPWAFRNRGWKKRPYFLLCEQRMLSHASSLFVTSEMEKYNLLRRIKHQSVEVLPLGCADPVGPHYQAARASLGWGSEKVILFLSRIDPKKGLNMLLEAMSLRSEVLRGWRLVIVGDGAPEYIQSLQESAGALASRLPTIDWVGPIWGSRRWRYLQGADLFVLPTHSENFGIAVLEAAHAGTPILTTSGTPWRDHANVQGFFITAPNSQEIAEGIVRACGRVNQNWTEQDRLRLSEWASDHFSWDLLALQYMRAYTACCKL